MATVATLMTTEELLALPDDGVERWLIQGELREGPMTKRNRVHSKTMTYVVAELANWLREQPLPRGEVLCGEAGVILQHDPDSTVGIDVAYISEQVIARQNDATTMIEGAPTLAIEIQSPNDTLENVNEKIGAYRSAGVPLVWIIDPYLRTVTVHRPDADPELFNVRQQISAEPHLPGFRVPVARLFE